MSTISSRCPWIVLFLAAFATNVATGQPLQDLTLEAPSPTAAVQPPPANAPLHWLDGFSRADGPLGTNWVVQAGVPVIRSFAATASSASASLATHVGGGGAALEADISMVGANLSYVALVLEYASLTNNLFIKVQAPTAQSTRFGAYGCRVGNNGNNGSFGVGFAALTSPFTSAHMRVSVDVDRNVTIVFSNIDGGSGSQVYTCSGAPIFGGSRIGIGTYEPQARIETFYGESFQSGDTDGSGVTNVGDVFYLINYLFAGGPSPK